MPDTVNAAVRTLNLPNVNSSSRDLALAALRFLRAGFLSASFLRRFFRANAIRFSLSSRWFLPRKVFAFVLPTCWVRHSHHVSTSPSSPTFAYSRVSSEDSSSPRFGSHISCGGGVPTLLPQARLPRETISLCWGASPPVDAVGGRALSASTSSRINRCHEGTLIHARTLI